MTLHTNKLAFLAELHDLRPLRPGLWLLAGDFNLIYRAEDKNNDRLDQRRMDQLWCFINEACLKEIHMHGRLFPWSNEHAHPTLEQIDRAFISREWDELYPASDLQSLSSMCNDHALLLLRTDISFRYRKRFHFCSIWPHFPSYLDIVEWAWHCPLNGTNVCR
jgi:hypothetical protein